MSILDALYEWHTMKPASQPGRREAQKRFSEIWRQAEKILGEEFGEDLRGRMFDYMDEECRGDFQAGFCLGAMLMSEVHASAAPWSAGP